MSHTFPLQEVVFPPLQLSESAKDMFIHTSLMQLTKALHDYDKYLKWQASRPSSLRYELPAMWKLVKKCENLRVYRRESLDGAVSTAPVKGSRRRARCLTLEARRLGAAISVDSVSLAPNESVTDTSWSPISTRSSEPTANNEWTIPTLCQVGTIEGTLDDVMYGSVSFDAVGTLITSSYSAEEIVDADTLYEIQGPTPEEPFRFLGLKWIVKTTSSSMNVFVWPRDFTFIAATGVLNRQGGERVGYELMCSVDLGKNFGPLKGKQIVRGQISSCYLYRQISANTVDVYMKTNFEPNGSIHESVAQFSALSGLTYCLKSARCAHNKKLSWVLAHPKPDKTEAGSARPHTIRVKKRLDCGVCTRPVGHFMRGSSCRVCNARICSTCFVKKKLSFPGLGHKTVDQRSVVICTHCFTYARNLSSFEIAKQEVAERSRLNQRRGTSGGPEQIFDNRDNSRNGQNKLGCESVGGWILNKRQQDKAEAAGKLLTNLVNSNHVQLPVDLQPHTKTQSSSIKNAIEATLTKSNTSTSIAAYGEYEHVNLKLQDDSTYEDVSILCHSLPEAVVQLAWGAVVPSPTNHLKPVETLPASPLSLSSPKKTRPEADDKQRTVWMPRALQSTIPRIHAGASTQEVLAQFAELCSAAENVYQAARKHTISNVEPSVLHPHRRTTRFDMNAVD